MALARDGTQRVSRWYVRVGRFKGPDAYLANVRLIDDA